MKQNRYIKTTLTLLATALLAGSCTQQHNDLPTAPRHAAPLGVNVEVTPQSRGVITGTRYQLGSSINIILHDTDGIGTEYNGVSQSYDFLQTGGGEADPGTWIPSQAVGLMVKEPAADVYAHYPATLPTGEVSYVATDKRLDVTLTASRAFGTPDGADFESFFMTLKPGSNETEVITCRSEVDIMTGRGTQVTTLESGTKETTIRMKHALAMVIVHVKRSPHLPLRGNVQQIVIRNKDAATPLMQGSVSLVDNAFTANTTTASYTRTMSGFPIDKTYYALLVYPATMAEGEAEMELTTTDGTYAMPMPAKRWEQGRVYIYNVEISANGVQIGDVLLTDWPTWIDKTVDME